MSKIATSTISVSADGNSEAIMSALQSLPQDSLLKAELYDNIITFTSDNHPHKVLEPLLTLSNEHPELRFGYAYETELDDDHVLSGWVQAGEFSEDLGDDTVADFYFNFVDAHSEQGWDLKELTRRHSPAMARALEDYQKIFVESGLVQQIEGQRWQFDETQIAEQKNKLHQSLRAALKNEIDRILQGIEKEQQAWDDYLAQLADFTAKIHDELQSGGQDEVLNQIRHSNAARHLGIDKIDDEEFLGLKKNKRIAVFLHLGADELMDEELQLHQAISATAAFADYQRAYQDGYGAIKAQILDAEQAMIDAAEKILRNNHSQALRDLLGDRVLDELSDQLLPAHG